MNRDPCYPPTDPLHLLDEEMTPEIRVQLRKIKAERESKSRSTIWGFVGVILTVMAGFLFREYELHRMAGEREQTCLQKESLDQHFKVFSDDLKTNFLYTSQACAKAEHYMRGLWAEQEIQQLISKEGKK